MWPSAKFIDERVAFSRMPAERELDEVTRDFDAVVVLVEEHELPYSLDEWEKRGLEFLHSPPFQTSRLQALSSSSKSSGGSKSELEKARKF